MILRLRETEGDSLKKYLYTSSAVAFLFWASPALISAVTFGPLTSGTVLSAVATSWVLKDPTNLPELISLMTQTKVPFDRIQEFIREEDQMKTIADHASMSSDISVDIEVGDYAWETSDQKSQNSTIKITERMKIMKGYKVAICGSVGPGKSSLLCSILGEIPRIAGDGVKVHRTKAYVSQSAWLQTGTVRDNIIFGKDMKEDLYKDVLDGCALSRDIEIWGDGDLCVVGERGMNLSGGQKQRIQLVRAAYSDSDIYILDDPFNAVDAHTGTHLFKKCLMGLLSEKTVFYATHQLEFLGAADLVLVMKDGEIVQSGKFEDLIANPNGQLVKQMTCTYAITRSSQTTSTR